MAAPTFLHVAGFKDAPQAPERDFDPDLDNPSDPMPVPKRKRKPGTTNVGRAGIRTGGVDPHLGRGGFVSPVQRRVERARTSSGFTPDEEAELKQGFAAIETLMTGQAPVTLPASDEPTDAEIEALFEGHPFNGTARTQYCRACFRARGDAVHG